MRALSVESAVRMVVIVLLDPACNALLRLVEVLVFVEPHLLFFQAAMESFDVTVALGMVVGRAPVRDAQLVQSFDIARRGKLGAVSVVKVKPVPR